MATKKPNKSGKKPAVKAETVKTPKEVKEVKEVKAPIVTPVTTPARPMKGFFAKKCDANENILTIFKTPKIWGALLGELIGTMMIIMFMLTLGIGQPIYITLAFVGVYVAIVGLSGAHLNPLVTAGMMATRRVSAIRGILYMLAQLLGGWIGLIIVNAFRLASESTLELPMMAELSTESFWIVAFIELLGAVIIAFTFARALRYARKQPLTFAMAVTGAIVLTAILGAIITQSFFGLSSAFINNPVAALMYQVLPTTANDFGDLAAKIGLALSAYVLIPMLGGIIGFYVSDVATRLSCGGYFCDCDDPCCSK